MRVISFDVGIKNMAYCIFDVKENCESSSLSPPSTSPFLHILDWNILNLMDEDKGIVICSSCTKTAKFRKNNDFFCMKHAKTSKYMIPSHTFSMGCMRKMKKEQLILFCHGHFIFVNRENIAIKDMLKNDIVETANAYFQSKMLEPITPSGAIKTKKTASDTDLICVGKNMKRLLDNISNIESITHVIIENQISPIATRMKTIQGMLAQYFIMKCSPTICIEFISSVNKLKGLVKSNGEVAVASPDTVTTTPPAKTKYKQNKKDGIEFCSRFLENNPSLKEWGWTMKMAKKDDYADAFLQAVWYLKQKKIVEYNPSGENQFTFVPVSATV